MLPKEPERRGDEGGGGSRKPESPHPRFEPPSIALPKGGGAIAGIGEKFDVNPATGTASLRVPIFATSSRAGFQPQLELTYDSGAGNGPFGLGWRLSTPSIARKTAQRLPRYRDEGGEPDTYVLPGAEDLVPRLVDDGSGGWNVDSRVDGDYDVRGYRPRIEGLFARIERWQHRVSGDLHWRSISRDNVTSVFGRGADARIADPGNPGRVFEWLIEESFDDRGNVIAYQHRGEDTLNVAAQSGSSPHESQRLIGNAPFANRYLDRVLYGNARPFDRSDWQFELVFDYGAQDGNPTLGWPVRQDPFSTYHAGFEIRTYRLCRRILMVHRFSELGPDPCMVRSTDLGYDEGPVATFLTSITQTGHVKDSTTGDYASKSLPPVEFGYAQAHIDDSLRELAGDSLSQLPEGLDGTRYRWVDLGGEGLSGFLAEHDDAWYYKRNLGDGSFSPAERVALKPARTGLRRGRQQLVDLDGDGISDLVQYAAPVAGFSERTWDGDWRPFKPFAHQPVVRWDDPNLRFIDVTGDGRSDLLISEDNVFVWHPSLGRDGFGDHERVHKALDEELGPTLVFADALQSIYLADMAGDGLTDIVRIRNGEVCYWPNLGYGRFGAKVTMGGAPWFDEPDQFEQRRVQLADIDGSGTTDIVYLGRDVIRFWINQSGNRWSDTQTLAHFPRTDRLSSVSVFDLLGSGTSCIVWSSPLPADAPRPMRYIDLMRDGKPYLMTSIRNNMGRETRLRYCPSTRFYLEDRRAGRPWITKLPFPVHVLERVETRDAISLSTFVNTYRYHHGFYDGVEREFRGFGMVEQIDTEQYAPDLAPGLFPPGVNVQDDALNVPPVLTRTWFHTGAFIQAPVISRQYAREYYAGDAAAFAPPDSVLPVGLTTPELREAYRALKGAQLRQEIYALDDPVDPEAEGDPYLVSEQSYEVRALQPMVDQPHAVFLTHARETFAHHYERDPADPRVVHNLTLEVDDFGNVVRAAAVSYPRRSLQGRQPEQERTLVTCTESRVANKPDEPDWRRIGVPVETVTYEITDPQPAQPYSLDAMRGLVSAAQEIDYADAPSASAVEKRPVEWLRTLYYADDLSGPLPLGAVESHALSYQTYQLAFTAKLLSEVYSGDIAATSLAAVLASEGGYVLNAVPGSAAWWLPSGRALYETISSPSNRNQFLLPIGFEDPFGARMRITYDSYDLLVTQTEDALQNTISAEYDYRVMAPRRVTDPNGNSSEAAFDRLGMVAGTAVMGKANEAVGDSLAGFVADPDSAALLAQLDDALADPHALLGRATSRVLYDVERFLRTRQLTVDGIEYGEPVVAYSMTRETHDADLQPGEKTRVQHRFVYSDGFGREVQTKIQAEPGMAPQRDASTGELVLDSNFAPVLAHADPRWVGTGRTIHNNKGDPVKQYEPFFSTTHHFENEPEMVMAGVTPVIHYDPIGRAIRTEMPDGTFSKVEFDAWRQASWDANDTVLASDWYAERQRAQADPAERRAANLAAKHAGTPSVSHLDAMGRTFLEVADNGVDIITNAPLRFETRTALDIEGKPLAVTDANGRVAFRYVYDLTGRQIRTESIDAGTRRLVANAAGKPIRAWDDRGHAIRTACDTLQRPTHVYVRDSTGTEVLAGLTVYGEAHPDPTLNLRGRVYQQYDTAGVATNEAHDFKGNLLWASRRLAVDYHNDTDWTPLAGLTNVGAIAMAAMGLLETELFETHTVYDALSRPVSVTTPDASVILPGFNEANLLEKVDVRLRGSSIVTAFVVDIDYDAKGQRTSIDYGNGARTEYTYDAKTFRLVRLLTTRPSAGSPLQDLHYTYDPVGNITAIHDDAQQTVYFNNQVVDPHAEYVYDAIYRLIEATGREHLGQTSGQANAPGQPTEDDGPWTGLPHPNDGQAMGRYTEHYFYDAVGNILEMAHAVSTGNWTRRYEYESASNRLRSTSLPADPSTAPYTAKYVHDAHGNMTRMPHLPQMRWDHGDRLRSIDLGVGSGTGTACYVYDAGGQRVRKVVENGGSTVEERIYIGGFEVYRRRNATGLVLERETLHIMGDKRRITMVEAKTVDGGAVVATPVPMVRYQFGNHLGSACLELDEQAAIIAYEEFFPYGGTAYQAVSGQVDVSAKRYRYTGKERDEESGLDYFGARYYAPWLARWTATDPIGIGDGLNVYCFVKNNPANHVDSDGKQSEDSTSDDEPLIQFENYRLRFTLPGLTLGPLRFSGIRGRITVHEFMGDYSPSIRAFSKMDAKARSNLEVPGIRRESLKSFFRGTAHASIAPTVAFSQEYNKSTARGEGTFDYSNANKSFRLETAFQFKIEGAAQGYLDRGFSWTTVKNELLYNSEISLKKVEGTAWLHGRKVVRFGLEAHSSKGDAVQAGAQILWGLGKTRLLTSYVSGDITKSFSGAKGSFSAGGIIGAKGRYIINRGLGYNISATIWGPVSLSPTSHNVRETQDPNSPTLLRVGIGISRLQLTLGSSTYVAAGFGVMSFHGTYSSYVGIRYSRRF
jgi:RHS repeat-associated protein